MTAFFPSGAPNQSASGTLSTVNSAVTLATDTLGSVDFALAGSPVGATVAFEATSDGTNWVASKAYPKGGTGAAGSTTAAAAGVYNVSAGGAKQVRARLSAITSGSFTVVANGTAAPAHVGVKNGNAADLQVTSTPVPASATPDRSGTINGAVSGAAIAAGGSGYAVGNTITLANGIVLTVATVNGSAVATVALTTPGNVSYANVQAMTNPVAQASSSGSGTGATFILTWVGVATLFAAANASRKSLEIINPGTLPLYAATTINNPAQGVPGSIPIAAGGSWQPPIPHQGAVYVYGSVAGQPVTMFEG
ncbi:hypothetical protein [Paraburkholderia aromaticivorans]|uniref:hypothetical protein n=1 Tax=Paraburkholderia aromaticivorans TaxID=2026199 RepID=UPI001456114E|nr:hypothetical protein [Paraburkholderia aromaticivorans]